MVQAKTAFSTGIESKLRITHVTNDLDELMEWGQLARPIVEKIAYEIIKMAQHDLFRLQKDTQCTIKTRQYKNTKENKSAVRIVQKAVDELNGRIDKVKDIVRGSTWADDKNHIAALCVIYEELHKTGQILPYGAKVVDFQNRFEKPTASGHRSGRAILMFPLTDKNKQPVMHEGKQVIYIAEQQVRHTQFEYDIENNKNPNKTSHKCYEQQRALKGRFVAQGMERDKLPPTASTILTRLFNTGLALHEAAARKHDLNNINFAAFRALHPAGSKVILAKDALATYEIPQKLELS